MWQECGKLFHVEKSCSLYNKPMSYPIARAPFNTHLSLDLKPRHLFDISQVEERIHFRFTFSKVFKQLGYGDRPQAGSCYFFFEEF